MQGRVLDAGEFYFTCFNESIINLSSHPSNTFFADWIFVGIGYKTLKAGNFEIGPLVQSAYNKENKNLNTMFLLQLLWLTDYKLHNRQKSN